jgi:hypothetical protein
MFMVSFSLGFIPVLVSPCNPSSVFQAICPIVRVLGLVALLDPGQGSRQRALYQMLTLPHCFN